MRFEWTAGGGKRTPRAFNLRGLDPIYPNVTVSSLHLTSDAITRSNLQASNKKWSGSGEYWDKEGAYNLIKVT